MKHKVTMPNDKALEYMTQLEKIVNESFFDPGYPIALSIATDALRAKQERENPQVLTWDELRKMYDEPVWVVFKADADGTTLRMWCLVENDPYGSLYLTNHLGGREEFATASDFETENIDAIYRYQPKEATHAES